MQILAWLLLIGIVSTGCFILYWRDVKETPPEKYTVKLTYFRVDRPGSYYSEGQYVTDRSYIWEIWDEVEVLARRRALPGLIIGHSPYIVLVNIPGHPARHPHLVIPGSPFNTLSESLGTSKE